MSQDAIVLPDHVEEEAKIYSIEFYTTTKLRLALFYLLCITTLGLVPLLCYWKNSVYCILKYKKSQPSDCNYVVVYGADNIVKHIKIQQRILYINKVGQVYRSFTYRLYSYYYDQNDDMFKACQFVLNGKTYNSIHLEFGKGLPSMQAYKERLFVYGPNSIDITVKSTWEILFKEVLSPYYLFQLFAWIFWAFFAEYEVYAWILFALSTLTLSITFYKIKTNYNKMMQNVQHQTQVLTYRPCQEEGGLVSHVPKQVDSSYLVPGDIIEIQPRMKMPCDVILLSGTCIMNESMVIGESEHSIKYALPNTNKKFDYWTSDSHILFGGTECQETSKTDSEPQVIGVVIRTGFSTMKGRLIRSYLYSKRENFQFYRDSLKYIAAMFVLAFACFIYTIKLFVDFGEATDEIIRKSLDSITIAVPPVLPTCISIGMFFASFRLERKNILCRSEQKINVAGKVQVAFFDKTGTLTEDSLDLHGVQTVSRVDSNSSEFQCIVKEDIVSFLSVPNPKAANNLLLDLMATCHSLILGREGLTGDPLDSKMFMALDWHPDVDKDGAKYRLETVDSPELLCDELYIPISKLDVVKRFPFNTKLRRISVVARYSKQANQRLNVKGAPKTIKRLCRPETIPVDYEKVLSEYTQNGFRVVACATRTLENHVKASDNLSREYYEKDLDFLGFIVFENKMKDITPSIVTKFSKADIPSVMLTGDNTSSAYFMAKQCSIIEPDQKVLLGTLCAPDHPRQSPKIDWVYMDEDFKEKLQRDSTIHDRSGTLEDNIRIEVEEANYSLKGLLPQNDQYKVVKSAKDDANTTIAMTGDTFRHLSIVLNGNPMLYQSILKKTKLFTKLRPDDKALIVREFQKFGYIVAMCGDGVNDCPALKIANVSLALNSNETSLAASFIGKVQDISGMDVLIREGRCSLMASMHCFKFMSMYSLIQTLSMAITYNSLASLPNPSYLYQDIAIVLPTAIALLLTKPVETLSKNGPSGSLLSPTALCSIIGQGFIQGIIQAMSVWIVQHQDWYQTPTELTEALVAETGDEEAEAPNYDSTILFFVGNFQLITMVIVFYVGRPFREPLYKNWVFTGVLIAITVSSLAIMLTHSERTNELFEIKDFDANQNFRWAIFGIVALNMTVSILYEKFFVNYIPKIFAKVFRRKRNYTV